MTELTTEEQLLKLPKCDVELAGIEWLADGGLLLTLLLQGADRRVARLSCSFASGLSIDLQFKERTGGRPMTWDTAFTVTPNGGWHVVFDFAGAPRRVMEFDCSAIHLEYVGSHNA